VGAKRPRLWRTLQYEDIYLKDDATVPAMCGLVFYSLAKRRREQQEAATEWNAIPTRRHPAWAAGPPQLTDDRSVGAWESMGPHAYDT